MKIIEEVRGFKAWALYDENNEIITIEVTSKKPKRYTIGTWLFFTTPKTKWIPVLITPITKVAKKKTKK